MRHKYLRNYKLFLTFLKLILNEVLAARRRRRRRRRRCLTPSVDLTIP